MDPTNQLSVPDNQHLRIYDICRHSYCGFLKKKTRFNFWKRLWFEIKDEVGLSESYALKYFVQPNWIDNDRALPLAGATVRLISEKCFELHCPGKMVLTLKAISVDDARNWLAALRHTIDESTEWRNTVRRVQNKCKAMEGELLIAEWSRKKQVASEASALTPQEPLPQPLIVCKRKMNSEAEHSFPDIHIRDLTRHRAKNAHLYRAEKCTFKKPLYAQKIDVEKLQSRVEADGYKISSLNSKYFDVTQELKNLKGKVKLF